MSLIVTLAIIFFLAYSFWQLAVISVVDEGETEKQKQASILLLKEKEEILLENYRFYTLLTEAERRKFIIRLHQFNSTRNFVGRNITVEPHMEMMIGAAAVKYSFGIRNFQLSSFKQIVIFPEEYYSRFTRQYHKGEANGLGMLAFSWKHFQEGLDSPDDNLNLGIHEFAHAYFLQQTKMEGEYPFNDYLFRKLRKNITNATVLKDIKSRTMFREYAFRNEMELFAIMSEHFFETPSDFKEETPILYNKLEKVLQQDPTIIGL